MENTNCGDSCAFVRSGFCEKDCECPFFSESWWETQEGIEKKQKLVKDCFPKRMMIEQNKIIHRQYCEQSVVEELRNRIASLESLLSQLVSQSKEFIQERNEEILALKREQLQFFSEE